MQPPRLARWFVAVAVPLDLREFVLGDLDEQFAVTARRTGRVRARLRYWRQASSAAWQLAGQGRMRHRHAADRRRGAPMMANLLHDIRVGVRTALRTPGYTAVSVLTLALAMGANTLLFSIANPLVLRPLPIQDPDGLGWVYVNHPERGVTRGDASLPDYLEWREGLQSFSALAAYDPRPATLLGHGDARAILTSRVSTNLMDVWGLQPHLGRLLQPDEDAPGAAAVGVLSHHFWRDTFASDPAVIGRTYTINDRATTIVGVMMPAIELGSLADIDVWVPLPLDPFARSDQRTVSAVGRLAPGATVDSANAELATFWAGQVQADPDARTGWVPAVVSTQSALASDDVWLILSLLGIIVAFVLLIACANLANLVLARLVARRQEILVRYSLGASRWRVVRPLLVEGALVSLAGALCGLSIAYGGLKIVNAVASEAFFRQVSIDGYVLAFTALLAMVAPLFYTLWPALSSGRRLASETRHGGRVAGQRSARRSGNVLVAGQVALALSLLVVSALAVQSAWFIRNSDIGIEPEGLLTWQFSLPDDRYAQDADQARFVSALAERLTSLRGADHVAVASHLPVIDGETIRAVSGTDIDGATDDERPWASWFAVTPDFFAAAGIDLVAGRGFEAGDVQGRQPVAILGRMAAERFFGDPMSAEGRSLTVHDGRAGRLVRVVGVVEDTRDNQLTRTSPQVYVPFDQWPDRTVTAVIRTDRDPVDLASGVRDVMRGLDDRVAVASLKPLTQTIDEELSSNAIINGLFVSFALLALALATAGLFGVISYSVGQRSREIGIRLALGASPASVGRMVVGEGVKVTVLGMVAGLLIALGLGRMSASLLFGVTASDPATFVTVSAIVLATAIVASAMPALRAMRVDPARTLRAD